MVLGGAGYFWWRRRKNKTVDDAAEANADLERARRERGEQKRADEEARVMEFTKKEEIEQSTKMIAELAKAKAVDAAKKIVRSQMKR